MNRRFVWQGGVPKTENAKTEENADKWRASKTPDQSATWRLGAAAKRGNEKRASARVRHGEAARMYNVDKIAARISSDQREYNGPLLDLSGSGLSMLVPAALPLNLPVLVLLHIGERQVRGQGLVKNRNKLGGQYRIGVQFTTLDPEDEGFLQLLYGPGGTYEEVDGLEQLS